MPEPNSDFQAGFNSPDDLSFDETKSEEWKKGWYARHNSKRRFNDAKDADFSSFSIPNKLLRKIGELAREAYDKHEASDMEGLTKEEWTLVEETITGFENR